MSTTTLYLIRHGHVHNPQAIFYGRLPRFRLSAEGRRQAQCVSDLLHAESLAAIFSSPLLRARQTADIIAAPHAHLPVRLSKQLIEVHTPFDGRPMAEAIACNFDLYTDSDPEFEQPVDIIQRVRRFVTQVCKEYAGQQIVAVTHGDIVTFSILWAKGLPLTVANKQDLTHLGIADGYPQPASITTLRFQMHQPNAQPSVTHLRPY